MYLPITQTYYIKLILCSVFAREKLFMRNWGVRVAREY